MSAVETTSHRAHGTYVKYVTERCRCEPCTIANRDYERARKQRVEPPYVGADRARKHLCYLAAHGVGLKSVALISGVSHGSLAKLVHGDHRRRMPPSKRIRRETERKILAVTIDQAPGGTREPAGPTWEIVDELVARGWMAAEIGRHVNGPTAQSLQLGRELVTRENARIIRSLLDEPVPPRRSRHGLHAVAQPEPPAAELETEPNTESGVWARYCLPRPVGDGDETWRARATCRRPEIPDYLFFPARGDRETLEAAQAICARCPVHVECLDYALRTKVAFGVWGGKSERQRRRIRAGRTDGVERPRYYRLNADETADIVARVEAGETQADLADEYDVGKSTITALLARATQA